MSEGNPQPCEERILVLAPTEKDARLCRSLLAESGVASTVCAAVTQVCAELQAGAGAAIITEESIAGDGLGLLAESLRRQPPWSDFPILMLMQAATSSAALPRKPGGARQRDLARTPGSGADAGQRRGGRAASPAPAIPDSRSFSGAATCRRSAAARGPAQRRIPSHARSRASAIHWLRSCMPRSCCRDPTLTRK